MGFTEGSFCGLDQRDGIPGIIAGLPQAPDLAPHFFGNRQTGGIIPCPVNTLPGRQLFQGLTGLVSIIGQLSIIVNCHDIMVNSHLVTSSPIESTW
jgi:hypothetical protein